jgi:uncharacterized iron-regulated membrane protein
MPRAITGTMRLRGLVWIHRWSSLACTLFLLMTCLTGLPLIFKEEIDDWLSEDLAYEDLPAETPHVDLDRIVRASIARYPDETILSVAIGDDEPKIVVFMAPSWDAYSKDQNAAHFLRFDARTAKLLKESKPVDERSYTLTGFMLQLHRNLFMGAAGAYLLAGIAIALIASLVSGTMLYSRFMRRLDFGTVRRSQSPRIKWLDLHNLIGISTVLWLFVVAATGLMNELSSPLFDLWRATDVRSALTHRKGPPVSRDRMSSLRASHESAQAAAPGMTVSSVIFPGGPFSTPHHYVFWAKGSTPLTAKLFQPILVDAGTGRFVGVLSMPWYLRVLELSRPLHFGDYGGLPLKMLWACLDMAAIVVLLSGLYLWTARFRHIRLATRPIRTSNGD